MEPQRYEESEGAEEGWLGDEHPLFTHAGVAS